MPPAPDPLPTEVAAGVFRCGTTLVNWYLVAADEGVTIVDAGLAGYRAQLPAAVEGIGRTLGDVRAIVLTHAHLDHIGFAEWWRRRLDIPVYVHADDEEAARTGRRQRPDEPVPMLPYLRYRGLYRLLAHFVRYGARITPVQRLRTYADGDALDVPGRPRVIHTPGHTRGHSALYFEHHGTLMVGDAFCTYNPVTGGLGPQLLPRAFNVKTTRALASLGRLRGSAASVALCGHGDPWTATVGAAVSEVERRRPV